MRSTPKQKGAQRRREPPERDRDPPGRRREREPPERRRELLERPLRENGPGIDVPLEERPPPQVLPLEVRRWVRRLFELDRPPPPSRICPRMLPNMPPPKLPPPLERRWVRGVSGSR